jgi:hypothetical protein
MRISARLGPLLVAAALASPLAAQGASHGVFVRLADGPAGTRARMVEAVPALLARAGWEPLAHYDATAGACRHGATVFVVQAPDYTRAVLQHGVRAAFALPLRLAVYESDVGTHLSLANPRSLARTIVQETGFDGPPQEAVAALRTAVAAGFPGTPVQVEYGQMRDRGLIGKTMGIVAGGPFPEKVEAAASVTGRSVADVAAAIAKAGAAPTGRWGLRVVYRLPLPGQDAELVGLTGARMEEKAFEIVGEGGDASRKGLACPGLDHAAAFPIELLVVREGEQVKVLLIDEMFRMKMYFEDAGRMKFAANMQMPGSIEDELRDLVEEAL